MRLANRAKWSATGLGTLAVLAAAGSWAIADRSSSVHADDPPPAVTAPLSLPLDAYQLSPQLQAEQSNLDNVITRACMKSYGIAYLTNVPDIRSRFVASTAAADSRRYGISDLNSAKERGYHLPPAMKPSEEVSTRTVEQNLTREQELVLTGQPDAKPETFSAKTDTVGHYNGKAIPRGGCIGQAVRTLRKPMSSEALQKKNLFAAGLQRQVFLRTQTHPQVLAVFKRWSKCMADQGFPYADPIKAATDPAWKLDKPATSKEVRTAVADVQCKQRTDLVRIEHQVEVDLQKAAIKKHSAALAPLKKAVDEQIAALQQAASKYGT
jgi:hypothetical protein